MPAVVCRSSSADGGATIVKRRNHRVVAALDARQIDSGLAAGRPHVPSLSGYAPALPTPFDDDEQTSDARDSHSRVDGASRRKVTNHDPPIAQKIDPKSDGCSRAGDKEANPHRQARRTGAVARGSWRSGVPIACRLTSSPLSRGSADLAAPQRCPLFDPSGFWRTMHARPDACARAILDSRLA